MERRLFKSVAGFHLLNSVLPVDLTQGKNPSLFESGLANVAEPIMTVISTLVLIFSKKDYV